MHDMIVVDVKPDYWYSEELKLWAARLTVFGITAYGSTKKLSYDRLKEMFSESARACHEDNTLESWLNDSNLKWRWANSDSYERESVSIREDNQWMYLQSQTEDEVPLGAVFA